MNEVDRAICWTCIAILILLCLSGCAGINKGIWNADLGGVHYKW